MSAADRVVAGRVAADRGGADPVAAPAPAPAQDVVRVGAPIRVMALTLWGVVGSLLTYGIAMTVIKAAALFG